MKISVIIPVYNAENYLRNCIDSIVAQTWIDIEIILINDGSTDSSGEICKSYCADPRVIYHYQNNAGVSAARNAGLDLATGDYICFVDSDDWLELDALERLQNETSDIVIYSFYHGEKLYHESLQDGIYFKDVLFPTMISYIDEAGDIAYQLHTIWRRLFKKKLIDDNRIRFDLRYQNGEDLLFTIEATIKADTISVKGTDYLYHYRPVENSLTTSYIINYWTLRKQIIDKMYDLIDSNDEFGILRNQMPLRIFSWAVTGIENELKYKQGKKEQIKEIITDPICDTFKGKLDSPNKLNKKYQRYYCQICDEDIDGILADYKRQIRESKRKKAIRKVKHTIKMILHLG